MPTRPAQDGGHTAFTDHRIARQPSPVVQPSHEDLRAWRDPPRELAVRNLGLAYVAVAERDQIPSLLERGRQLLNSVKSSFATDSAVLTSLGVAYLRQHQAEEAVRLFQAAVDLHPGAATYHVNLATALVETGKPVLAITHLNRAIDLDMSLEVAYRRLVEVYARSHRQNEISDVFRRYLKFRPQSLAAREAIRTAPQR
jgi:predicted Zn-dependent protease